MPLVQLVKAPRYRYKGLTVERGQVIEVSNKERNHLVLNTNGQFVDYDPAVAKQVLLPEDDDVPAEVQEYKKVQETAPVGLVDPDDGSVVLPDGTVLEKRSDGTYAPKPKPEDPSEEPPKVVVSETTSPVQNEPSKSPKSSAGGKAPRSGGRGSEAKNQQVQKAAAKPGGVTLEVDEEAVAV